MNKIARRSAIAAVLAIVLVAGFGIFVARFCLSSDKWVITAGSPHVYDDNGQVECGVAVDADGNLLLDMRDGWTYTENEALRKATLHWLGDRESNILAPALNTHLLEMTGFDTFNGMYSYADTVSVTQLTLAASVQIAAYEAMGSYKGTVAVYNYKTGQLLCSVSTPSFDPDDLPDLENDSTGQYEGIYFNRFTEALYTPGSIFKVVTLAAALDTIPDIREQTFTCTGSYTIGADKITCEYTHWDQDLQSAFRNSCNCAFAQIALQVGPENMERYAKSFGLTQSIRFDGITTAAGEYAVVDADDVNIAWSGIGQYNDLINPCSFLTFIGAVANDGTAVQPYLVETITVGDQASYQAQPQAGRTVLSPETAAILQEYMRSNALYYGANRFGALTVCAKTGTAQVDGQNKPNAMLVGFVDDEDYPLAFIVCAENAGYGGDVCIPIAAKVLDACKAYMDS